MSEVKDPHPVRLYCKCGGIRQDHNKPIQDGGGMGPCRYCDCKEFQKVVD